VLQAQSSRQTESTPPHEAGGLAPTTPDNVTAPVVAPTSAPAMGNASSSAAGQQGQPEDGQSTAAAATHAPAPAELLPQQRSRRKQQQPLRAGDAVAPPQERSPREEDEQKPPLPQRTLRPRRQDKGVEPDAKPADDAPQVKNFSAQSTPLMPQHDNELIVCS
jgi:hypothetical protein